MCEYHLATFAGRTRKRIADSRNRFQCTEAGCTTPVEGRKWYCPRHSDIRAERHHRRYINATADPAFLEQKNHSRAIKRRAVHIELRERVIAGYGGRCACCGEDQPEFLTIDHVEGDGWKEKRKFRADTRLLNIIKANFPPRYQVLCYNCNCGKRNGSECPHQRAIRNALRLVK